MTIASRALDFLYRAFLVLLPLQFLFAGYGVFGGDYGAHEAFGGALLHALSLLMVIAALVARRWREAGLSFLLFALFALQIGMVEIGRSADQPWLSALHPFIAFLYWPYVYFLLWQRRPARSARPAPVVEPAVLPQA